MTTEGASVTLDQDKNDKATQISLACTKPFDVDTLCLLASSDGGLLDDELRQRACTLKVLTTHNAGLRRI